VAVAAPAAALAQEGLVHPAPDAGWYFGARAIAGASHEDTGFRTPPPGAAGVEEDSYNPQENFGAGALFGYRFRAWGLPLRGELSGSWMYRHDADMRVFLPGGGRVQYQNDLAIWDIRASLLADLLDFGWGRLYAGGGLGAALLESEVSIEGAGISADHDEWTLSPSAQAGIVVDDVFRGFDLELSYRFRWFGDTQSGRFPNGARLEYENAHIHEVMLGVIVPVGR
jgi:opacity protein-like surface antigen